MRFPGKQRRLHRRPRGEGIEPGAQAREGAERGKVAKFEPVQRGRQGNVPDGDRLPGIQPAFEPSAALFKLQCIAVGQRRVAQSLGAANAFPAKLDARIRKSLGNRFEAQRPPARLTAFGNEPGAVVERVEIGADDRGIEDRLLPGPQQDGDFPERILGEYFGVRAGRLVS